MVGVVVLAAVVGLIGRVVLRWRSSGRLSFGPRIPFQEDVDMANARERGASAVEYGLLIAAIAVVVTATAFGLGNLVKQSLGDLSSSVEKCSPNAEACAPAQTGGTSTSTTEPANP
jgi:pilus assembly protein Flp/PilA